MLDVDVTREIERRQAQRIHALISEDWDLLDPMRTDDLVHVHANGSIDSKASHLSAVANKVKFKKIKRTSLSVRSFGATAASVAPLKQRVVMRETGAKMQMHAVVTQLWIRTAPGWRPSGFQATPISQG